MDDNQQYLPPNNAGNQSGASSSLPQPPMSGADQLYALNQQNIAGLQNKINSLPPEANDLDVIEKEWVNHLKEIVLHTTEDPYTQQAEISKAKADYMRKRYNKDIKIAEG